MERIKSNGPGDGKMLRRLWQVSALAGTLLGLAACVYVPVGAPAGYAYGPGYDGAPAPEQGYYYAPDYGYPPVVGSVNLGFGYWGGRGGDRHDR